ncbi:DNApol-eta isoform X1 [Colletes gigas]|uniref:DNApol-eta isoform X1 n=2 Tax=Colletes gigas TaxID=935657 RepID=UPI001C9BA074|nr:DNApol-eta isoform X1 [Colletes gigas]
MANSNNDRIVVLIDMDCFFCQVETKLRPEYEGKPLAVVQYNQWKLGGIIAVNYEAREYGVTRHMRGEEAKEKCQDLILASVPCLRGKADTSRYRSAGREVIEVIRKHCNVVERASVDEAYMDLTDTINKRMLTNSTISTEHLITQLSNTFVVGYSEVGKNNEEDRSKGTRAWISNIFEELEDVKAQKLAMAGAIVEELRDDIFKQTGFKCSAGIAQNKILAKLACGLHKPNRQTILPADAVSSLYSSLPVKKVRNLGGKFGDVVVESLNCNVMGDLLQYSLQYLQKRFDDKTGSWLYNIARGIDNEPVTMRLVSKSIGACKKFPGKQAITSLDVLKHWAGELSAEVCERLEQDLEENERRATLLTICYHYYQNKTVVSQSRSCTLNSYKPEKMAKQCVEIISRSTQNPVAYVGLSAGKFIQAKGSENFINFFKASSSEHRQKISVQPENTDMECIKLTSNTVETITDTLEIGKNIGTISNTHETKNVSNGRLKSAGQNSKSSAELNEEIPNMEIDWSPTSRRLNTLITSLNERNKKKTVYEKKINNSNLNKSLHQNQFEGSFFLNIFNPEENKLKGARRKETTVLTELNENVDIEYEKFNENITEEVKIENDCNIPKEKSTDFKGHENITSNNKTNSAKLDVDKAQCSYRESVQTSSNAAINGNDIEINSQSTIKLGEIFPDLNNIDPNVVALLPLNLQKEAKLYMKAQNRETNARETSTRNSKVKGKSKTNVTKGKKKSNGIYSFLVKRDLPNVTDVPPIRCVHCREMIAASKYNEHCDFHVAENLQKELNNSMLRIVNIERKVDTYEVNSNSMKRRSNDDILKPEKSYKSTSFLSYSS